MATKRKPMKKAVVREIKKDAGVVLSYKNPEYLARFINDRAKIYDKKQTGFSAKLQRKLSREVKRARHLGLLAFKPSI